MKIQYVTYDHLIKYGGPNKHRLKKRLAELKVDVRGKFPITYHFLHNDDAVRCVVAVNSEGNAFRVDLPIGTFNKLPTEEVPADLVE